MTRSDSVDTTSEGRTGLHVDVTQRGPVSSELAREAAARIGELEQVTTGPLTHARVVLTQERNPRIERRARAEGQLLLAGHPIRARVAAPTMGAAIDELSQRMREQLRRYVDRLITHNRLPATAPTGEWRHGAWLAARPPHSWRPPGERRIIRRKTFALEPLTALEAAAEMAALDHRFYLFQDAETGADAVAYHRADDGLAVIETCSRPSAGGEGDLPREPSRYSTALGAGRRTGRDGRPQPRLPVLHQRRDRPRVGPVLALRRSLRPHRTGDLIRNHP